ncbi:hypothetical protein FACS1894184_03270 [Clostridia bacterium]|nr:hypothetical protein FACS1894184_03270 [Clostridia bacterium]
MQVSAVYACVRLLSEAIASLPLHVYKYNEDGGKERVPQHPLFRILYALKTGMSRAKLARLMEQETWMNARKAIEWGFADGILDDPKHRQPDDTAYSFSRRAVTNSLLDKLQPKAVQAIPAVVVQAPTMPDALPPNPGTPAESLAKRLSLISH